MNADSPSIRLDDLLSQASWVRALATRLVRDPDVAEDVVQETWLAALRTPPDRPGHLRAWLGRVVRNAVHSRGRSGARREAREHEVARERGDAASADELAEKVETQRHLAAHVLALGEPYRRTVLLRYYEGLSAAEIARRMDVPAGTVRWRLKQGLDELRSRLDDGYGSRRAWCLALAPLVDRDLLLKSGGATAGGAGLASLVKGVLAMNLGLKLTLASGAALLALAFSPLGSLALDVLRVDPAVAAPDEAVTFAPLVEEPPAGTVEPAIAAAQRSEVAPDGPPAAAPETGARVRVLDVDGTPLVGAKVKVRGYPETTVATDAEGTAVVPLPETWDHERGLEAAVLAEARACMPGEVHFLPVVGEVRELGVLRLQPAGAVEGRVLDAEGRPVAGAWIQVWIEVGDTTASRLAEQRLDKTARPAGDVRTDSLGRFRLEPVPVGRRRVWAAAEGHLANVSGRVEVRRGQVSSGIEIGLGVVDPSDFITGRVVDPEGQPVRYARLEVRFDSGGRSGSSSFSTDREGAFRFAWSPRVPHTLRVSDPAGTYPDILLEEVEGSGQELLLRFSEARPLEITARDTEGPVRDFALAIWNEDLRRPIVASWEAQVVEGRARVATPQETFWVEVDAPGHDLGRVGPFSGAHAPGEIVVDLVPLPGVHGRVLAAGKPLPGARVSLWPVARQKVWVDDFASLLDTQAAAKAVADEEGRFELTLRDDGRFVLRAEAAGLAPTELGPLALAKDTGAADLELALTPGGAIEGQVRGQAEGAIVAIHRGDGRPRTQRVGQDGAFRFENLTPGPWMVTRHDREILAGRNGTSTSGLRPFQADELGMNCVVTEGGTTRFDLGTAAEPPVLVGHLLLNGVRPKDLVVDLHDAAQGMMALRSGSGDGPSDLREDGSFEIVAPHPGRYRLVFQPQDDHSSAALSVELELFPGTNTWSRDLAAGGLVLENARPPHEFGVPLDIVLGRVDGVDVVVPVFRGEDGRAVLSSLPAGDYRLVRFELEELMSLGEFPHDREGVLQLRITAGRTTTARVPD